MASKRIKKPPKNSPNTLEKVEIQLNDKKEGFWKKNSVSVTALIISILSLSFTIWQAQKIRVHNRLSVTPKIQATYNLDLNEFSLVIKNTGIGPAIIDDINLTLANNKKYSTKDNYSEFWSSILTDSRIPDSLRLSNLRTFLIAPGGFIPANSEIDFLRVIKNSLTNENFHKLLIPFRYVNLSVSYHSVYNEARTDSLGVLLSIK